MEEKNFVGFEGLKYFWTKIESKVKKIIQDEIAEIVAEAPESLDTLKEIADWISTHEDSASAMNTAILANTEAISGKADKSHTHTKSEITDFPTSLPANGGTADSAATANNGFNSSTVTDSTPGWGYLTSDNGYSNGRTYSFANGGGIATAEKDGKSSLQVDGDLYVHEGLDKVATLNDIPTSLPANGGTADRVTGINYTGEQSDCISAKQTTESFNNSSSDWASYIICNHGNGETYYNQMLRLPFFSDTIQLQRRVNGELKGWKNIAILENSNTWTNNQSFNGIITPQKGSTSGDTVSIGRDDGIITIGDINNSNSGYTIINNDCKMLCELNVSGDCTLNGGSTTISGDCTLNGGSTTISGDCTLNGSSTTISGDCTLNGSSTTISGSCIIKNTSDNKYKSVVSGEITGTTLTLYLN